MNVTELSLWLCRSHPSMIPRMTFSSSPVFPLYMHCNPLLQNVSKLQDLNLAGSLLLYCFSYILTTLAEGYRGSFQVVCYVICPPCVGDIAAFVR